MGVYAEVGGLLLSLLALAEIIEAFPKPHNTCPPFTKGTFTIQQPQLYSENADWDVNNCIVYFGSLFNASVVVYDPYKDAVLDIIMFDGITHNPALHIGGVEVDPQTRLVSVVVDAAAPFNTGGRDISGDNFIIKYDPAKKRVLWNKNITNRWLVPRHHPQGRSRGCCTRTMVPAGADCADKDGLFRARGHGRHPARTPSTALDMTDAIYFPPRYNGKVLLIAENAKGITVLRSRDGSWRSAEHLGTVPNDSPAAQGGIVTAAVQIGENIFMVEEFFADPPIRGSTAGNRTSFPLVDITSEVERLLEGSPNT